MKTKKLLLPPVYFLIALCLMAGLHHFFPVYRLIPAPYFNWGFVLVSLGGVINFSGVPLFVRNKTTIRPFKESSSLITSGVYRFSRNPLYLGMTIILSGMAIFFGTATPFLVPLMFPFLIIKQFISVEESMLTDRFGEEYIVYRKRVRRWI
ncbi:MAG: isoprenylcysteine carboxylmethyltransferase family protein [Myxococcota bacterium]